MIGLLWNVQGLGNPETVNALADHVRTYKPSLVFVSETKASKRYVERLRAKLGFD